MVALITPSCARSVFSIVVTQDAQCIPSIRIVILELSLDVSCSWLILFTPSYCDYVQGVSRSCRLVHSVYSRRKVQLLQFPHDELHHRREHHS